MIFVGRESRHPPVVEPYDSKVMISEAGSSLAILPSFVFASELSVARWTHDSENLLFGVAGVYQHRLLFERPASRQQVGADEYAEEMDEFHGGIFLPPISTLVQRQRIAI